MPVARRIAALAAGSVLLAAAPSFAANQLRIILPEQLPSSKTTLRLYKWPADQDWPIVNGEWTVGDAREFSFPVDSGSYGVEVVGLSRTSVSYLRKTRFAVKTNTTVALNAMPAVVAVKIGGVNIGPSQLAIRRIGDGEVRWTGSTPEITRTAPELTLSADEPLMMSCVAEKSDTVLALWRRVTPVIGQTISFDDTQAPFEIKAVSGKGSPPMQTAELCFGYPEVTITLKNALAGRRLLTNRDRAMVSYLYQTTAGEVFDFVKRGQVFTKKTDIALSGPLTPFVLGAWLSRKDESGKWVDELVRRVYLCDPSGRWVNLQKSNFSFRCQFSYRGLKVALEDGRNITIDGKAFKPEHVSTSVSYRIGGKLVNHVKKAEGWSDVVSDHFKIDSPPALRQRAKAFLQMAEVIRKINTSLCGRRGPNSSYIKLRGDVWNAEAQLGKAEGGEKELRMVFPFEALERFDDPLAEPDLHGNSDPFVAHELLHGFGYDHGPEMSHLELLAEATYRRLRWQAVDTGRWPVWDN